VIAISEHARETLIERHDLDPDRVRTIHHGLDHERFNPDPGRPREPFLLYPAGRWRHKNHERLFEAFALLRRERRELGLVLTGYEAKGELPDGVEARGRVSDEELVELYRSAACLVFPSLYEGFGLPPLEAMACGCPVAVARATSLPEVCGEAAEYFDPMSAQDMAAAIGRALDGTHVEQVLTRAAEFSWEACARAHDAVYRELTASS
jgi:glycosyltransferase involved in cell wall biosynthesis